MIQFLPDHPPPGDFLAFLVILHHFFRLPPMLSTSPCMIFLVILHHFQVIVHDLWTEARLFQKKSSHFGTIFDVTLSVILSFIELVSGQLKNSGV
jgi:hypothetical protein